MNNHVLSEDTQAILLLCGPLGTPAATEIKALNVREYNRVADWLRASEMRPGDLLRPSVMIQLQEERPEGVEVSRVGALLDRGTALALATEGWTNQGMWVLSRADSSYPRQMKERLKRSAPPILYGAGNVDLLSEGGLAVVGSRNAEPEAGEFTRRVGNVCALQGIQVISGAARGIDAEAMGATLDAGGTVIGILPGSLAWAVLASGNRQALLDERLVLTSPYRPEAGFTVGQAMGRNKTIYALADWALVVSASKGKGGTWTGAMENLKQRRVPLFVRDGDRIPAGNRHLLSLGGNALTESDLDEEIDLRQHLTTLAGFPVQSDVEKNLPVQAALAFDQPVPPATDD
ncbi:MAG: DNA-processing protein DprA [Chloroflexota bacterium]|nr:DNA-processing protein DprA [Chloroflexota bacterium]